MTANANADVLFEDDFSNDNPAVAGEWPSFSGPFKVRLHSPSVGPSTNGNQRVSYALEVVDDPSGRGQEGCIIRDGQNVPKGEKAHVSRRFWLSTLESLGHNVRALRRRFKLTIDMLDQKTGYILFKTPEDNNSQYGDVTWVPKARYEAAAARIREQAEAGTLKTTVDEPEEIEVDLPDTTAVTTEVDEDEIINLV